MATTKSVLWMLLVLVLLAISDFATAQTYSFDAGLNVSWTGPTERENGAPLACEDLSGYTLYYAVSGGPGDGETVTLTDGCATSHTFAGAITTTIDDLLDGSVELTVAISATDQNGLQSGLSPAETITVPVPQSVIDEIEASPPVPPVIINASGTMTIEVD